MLKQHTAARRRLVNSPAAFGRLCVETFYLAFIFCMESQPPSGGCVLKLANGMLRSSITPVQPPSGGCVLKRRSAWYQFHYPFPAAFGRLCVETRL